MSPLALIRGYRYFRAALASFIGFGFLVAGAFQTRGASSDLLWFVLLFALCQLGAFRLYRTTRASAEGETKMEELLRKREARMSAQRDTTGPVVGKTCAACDRRIVIENDGCRCKQCSAPLHDDCKTEHLRLAHTHHAGTYR